jgi:Cellulose biosynthesis protein BcsS
MSGVKIKALGALFLFVPGAALAGAGYEPYPLVSYTELDSAKKGQDYFYSTLIAALNGDLGKDGVLFRAEGSFGGLGHAASPAAVNVNDQAWRAGALIGYQIIRDSMVYNGFAGADYRDARLTPFDPGNPAHTSEYGAKFIGEISTLSISNVYLDLSAYYSTVASTYFVRGRAGGKVSLGETLPEITVGPEGSLLGEKNFNAKRAGVFAMIPFKLGHTYSNIVVAGGYQWAESTGQATQASTARENGGFANLSFTFLF